MAALSLPSLCTISFFLFFFTSLVPTHADSGYEFRVGGPRGWIEPTGNETETYNHWAMRNRFHIGDSVYFKYENDSVLVVDREDYIRCNNTDPILKFVDGNTTIQFDRFGFFYFISGKPGHCKSGQKLVIRVMVHPEVMGPRLAPSPQPVGGLSPGSGSGSSPFGPPKSNASLKLSAASVIMTALGGVLVVLLLV